jgi:hypothetical protein
MAGAGRSKTEFIQIIFGAGEMCVKENVFINQTSILIYKTDTEKNSLT